MQCGVISVAVGRPLPASLNRHHCTTPHTYILSKNSAHSHWYNTLHTQFTTPCPHTHRVWGRDWGAHLRKPPEGGRGVRSVLVGASSTSSESQWTHTPHQLLLLLFLLFLLLLLPLLHFFLVSLEVSLSLHRQETNIMHACQWPHYTLGRGLITHVVSIVTVNINFNNNKL